MSRIDSHRDEGEHLTIVFFMDLITPCNPVFDGGVVFLVNTIRWIDIDGFEIPSLPQAIVLRKNILYLGLDQRMLIRTRV